MTKAYKATIEYTIYPDENGLLDGDFDMYDEDELKDNHRTPDELKTLVREELFEMITDFHNYNNLYNWIDVEVIDSNVGG